MKTIQLTDSLDLTATMLINGYSQAGAAANTNAFGQAINAALMIELVGVPGENNFPGIEANAESCRIEGLVINRCSTGVVLRGKNSVLQGCFIGTDAAGTTSKANEAGVTVMGDGATIGGTQPAHRNLISGNTLSGVFLPVTLAKSINTVSGNYIGTDVSGAARLANKYGIAINGASDQIIGGTAAGAGNVISGNAEHGIYIDPFADITGALTVATHNHVEGNRIGTNAAGTAALGNGLCGVLIENTGENTIGGFQNEARNIISGNGTSGVQIEYRVIEGAEVTPGADKNVVVRNFIGTDLNGTAKVANGGGIFVRGGSANQIGENIDKTAVGNVISGNTNYGIRIEAKAAESGHGLNNSIWGNRIGVDAGGNSALSNLRGGVYIEGIGGPFAMTTEIGGAAEGQRNIISANGAATGQEDQRHGIHLRRSNGNVIKGNYIGLGANGTAELGNQRCGIVVELSSNTVIGGPLPGEGNFICNNVFHGIRNGLGNNQQVVNTLTKENRIGVNVVNAAAPNGRLGINAGQGIASIGNGNSFSDVVAYNVGGGISIEGDDNIITGSTIYSNTGHGIEIVGSNNDILSNTIGKSGLGNTLDGIAVVGASSVGNTISLNSIYANGGLGIDLANDDVTANDTLDPDSGPNRFQNFPVIATATFWEGTQMLDVIVNINSTPNTTFNLELFLNDAADPSGYGEGQTFFTIVGILTDANGNGSMGIMTVFTPGQSPLGKYLTATATNTVTSDTSEFSQARQIVAGSGGGGGPPPGPEGGSFGLTSGSNVMASGSEAGEPAMVQVVDASTGRGRFALLPYGPRFTGGVRAAVADVNGDGVPDVITAPGAGGTGQVLVFSGTNGAILHRLTPFAGFTGGLFVVAGDATGDGKADLIVGVESGGSQVKLFSGASGAELRGFTAFGSGFTGGVRLATGDVNGDGKSDLIVAAGAGTSPQVKVFSGADNSLLTSFLAYESDFLGGVFVAAGDFNGDGKADIVTGSGAGRMSQVKLFRRLRPRGGNGRGGSRWGGGRGCRSSHDRRSGKRVESRVPRRPGVGRERIRGLEFRVESSPGIPASTALRAWRRDW